MHNYNKNLRKQKTAQYGSLNLWQDEGNFQI